MWPYPRIVAHRGGGALAPENTIAAMRCGLTHGFQAVEFDVMLARDGVSVVMHDTTFGRTVAGEGNVADYTAQELAQRDAGAWFGEEFIGEPVPTLEQVAAFCMHHHIWMNVEIKPVPGFEDQTGWVVAQTVQRACLRISRTGRRRRCRCCLRFHLPRCRQRNWPPPNCRAPSWSMKSRPTGMSVCSRWARLRCIRTTRI